jgi:hypothetical protein
MNAMQRAARYSDEISKRMVRPGSNFRIAIRYPQSGIFSNGSRVSSP